MKFFTPALIFCGVAAFGQSPQVPHKMQFSGMTLTVRDDARREIQKDVDALTQSPKHFNIKVERARTYFPIIEKIFAEERLPDDFKYLSLQESALVPDAVSPSNAVGFWQFLEVSAREMGLRMDAEVDERMNIVSASRAAAKYLKKNNHYFNNWVYALQAYQMGAGGVMRAVGEKDLGVRHMEITTDTYWYVKKYLAHKIAFENAVQGKASVEVINVYTTGGKSPREIANESSVEEVQLREFNKWLKGSRVPTDKEYAFLIPKGEGVAGFGVLAVATPKAKTNTELPKSSVEEDLQINGIPVIRAMKEESLAGIAERGHISLKKFLRVNEMSIDNPLQMGQLYFLDKKRKRALEDLYTLKPGEDLWTVSQRFGVQQKSLIRFNDLKQDSKLNAGYTLYLRTKNPGEQDSYSGSIVLLDETESFAWDKPLARTEKKYTALNVAGPVNKIEEGDEDKSIEPLEIEKGNAGSVYEVKLTDTLYSVARQYGVTIKELMEWNNKKDFSLSVGEKLKVSPR